MAKITILLVGTEESPLIPQLLEIENITFNIICNNILDFELPPRVENTAPIWHRHELRNILRQIGEDKFTISASLKNLLQENDILEISEEYLGVTSHISQIEQNSKDLFVAYDLLSEQADRPNISLTPLVNRASELIAIRNKKCSPLRYYQLEEEFVEMPLPENVDKKRANSKDLYIHRKDKLKELKLSDQANRSMNESDLIIILPTDLISLSVLVYADDLEKQIKNISTPLVLIWPFSAGTEVTEVFSSIAKELDQELDIEGFAKDLSFLTDYVIIDKDEKDNLAVLRKFGCHVLTSDFLDDNHNVKNDIISTLLSVADLEQYLKEGNSEASEDKDNDEEEEDSIEDQNQDLEDPEEPIKGKKISQLTESPEEAGIERLDKVDLGLEENNSDIEEILEDISQREIEIDEDRKIDEFENPSPTEKPAPKQVDEIPAEPTDIEKDGQKEVPIDDEENAFEVREEEDWIDSVKRAIEEAFDHNHEASIEWLIEQSQNDSDREMQIAELAINAWVDSRSTPDRKSGADIISTLSKNHRETYVQMLQKQMIQAVKEMQEDKRRLLIPLFQLIRDVDIGLSELLIRAITKDLGVIGGEDELSVIETAKLTLLQLVIQSRRLTRISIQELLNILESRPNIGPEIWNILTAFDAGSISIELVTNFSIDKADEIIRRSNHLRFTGSFYSTINRVLKAWKDGDKAAISSATGTILPEETLRKFERLELARKLDKLKMVQLTTLAESLGKDTETVERLITELIVNDELKAEMKLIEDKMYLVSVADKIENSGK